MKKENITAKMQQKMAELKEQRIREKGELGDKINEIKNSLSDVERKLQDAIRRTDLDAYQTAEADKNSLSAALKMYQSRLTQLDNLELIAENESDKLIDDLMEYESTLQEDFEKNIAPHLEALAALVIAYNKEIGDAETTLHQWTHQIHANYRTFGRMYQIDKETGQKKTRLDHPVPVRQVAFIGGDAFVRLRQYLKEAGMVLI